MLRSGVFEKKTPAKIQNYLKMEDIDGPKTLEKNHVFIEKSTFLETKSKIQRNTCSHGLPQIEKYAKTSKSPKILRKNLMVSGNTVAQDNLTI